MPLNREGIFKTGIDRKGPQYLDATDIIGLWFEIKKGTPGSGSTTGGAEGAIQFSRGLDIFGGDVDRFFWDDANKRIGIGANDPDFDLQVTTEADTYPRGIAVYQHSDSFRPAIYIGRKTRGTHAAPTAIEEDDIIVELAGDAWDGSDWGFAGAVLIAADEDWDATSWGNRLEFWTGLNGAVAPQRRWVMDNIGHFWPSDDAVKDIGTSSLRVRDLYLSRHLYLADFTNAQHDHRDADDGGTLDHGLALTGLSDDDHSQYAFLAGRAGGQTLNGGNAASENLTLESTAHATKGFVRLAMAGGDVQWGRALDALGGGVAPTFGTIGGTGPTVAGQNSWMRVIDSTGATFWVPVWK